MSKVAQGLFRVLEGQGILQELGSFLAHPPRDVLEEQLPRSMMAIFFIIAKKSEPLLLIRYSFSRYSIVIQYSEPESALLLSKK